MKDDIPKSMLVEPPELLDRRVRKVIKDLQTASSKAIKIQKKTLVRRLFAAAAIVFFPILVSSIIVGGKFNFSPKYSAVHIDGCSKLTVTQINCKKKSGSFITQSHHIQVLAGTLINITKNNLEVTKGLIFLRSHTDTQFEYLSLVESLAYQIRSIFDNPRERINGDPIESLGTSFLLITENGQTKIVVISGTLGLGKNKIGENSLIEITDTKPKITKLGKAKTKRFLKLIEKGDLSKLSSLIFSEQKTESDVNKVDPKSNQENTIENQNNANQKKLVVEKKIFYKFFLKDGTDVVGIIQNQDQTFFHLLVNGIKLKINKESVLKRKVLK